MAAQGQISVHRCSVSEAAGGLSSVFVSGKTDTCGGLSTALEQLQESDCFVVCNSSGEKAAYYALQAIDRPGGREVVIVAAAGTIPGADLVRSVIPYIEQQVSGAKALTVHTRRRGLVAKLAAQGFRVDGFILRKALQ